MKFLKSFTAISCAAVCAVSLAACSAGKSTRIGKPAEKITLTYEQRTSDSLNAFRAKAENFAADFAAYAYDTRKDESNFAVSPVSVYMALSLAAECADGTTRGEILNALGVTHSELKENFPLFYNSLAIEHKRGNKLTGTLIPSNSVWVNEGTPVNQPCIDALSDYYYAYSYSADFAKGNRAANNAVRKFVKDQTKGLIDKDFNFSEDTLFTLINTLYLKTIWNEDGDDLRVWDNCDFKNADGTLTNTALLQGYYNAGRAYKTEKYSTFFTKTYDGYKIKFLVPNEGYSVEDVFTSENIAAANSLEDYNSDDAELQISYFTRCLFPEYKCSYDNEINGILKDKFGIDKFFNDPGIYPAGQSCDFSNLSTEKCYCSSVKHVTDLTVDKKGIEGAAVTVIQMDGATSAGPGEYERVYEDFIIDRAFGFIITDPYDVTLFSGVVNSL